VVSEGDNNVSQGELTWSMTAVDQAGNESFELTLVDATNLSIDASRPVITQAFVSSNDDNIIVGETVEITVVADQPGYRNHTDTRINGVEVSPSHLTFTDLGNNLYQYAYTVQEDDGSVESGNLTINIVLQDSEPYDNVSIAFTNLDANNVSILTNRPGAIVSGSTEICSGDSARVSVLLSGATPWVMTFSDGTTTFQRTSTTTIYTEWFQPEATKPPPAILLKMLQMELAIAIPGQV
jgi:hypothetical protein